MLEKDSRWIFFTLVAMRQNKTAKAEQLFLLNSSQFEMLSSRGMQKRLSVQKPCCFPNTLSFPCFSDLGNRLRATQGKLSRHGRSETPRRDVEEEVA